MNGLFLLVVFVGRLTTNNLLVVLCVYLFLFGGAGLLAAAALALVLVVLLGVTGVSDRIFLVMLRRYMLKRFGDIGWRFQRMWDNKLLACIGVGLYIHGFILVL